VNASTIGMAVSGLVVALVSHRLPRRGGIWVSLALLTIPTALLAHAPDLATFTVLRIVQGLFMSAAFTLTMAYLSSRTPERPRPARWPPTSPAMWPRTGGPAGLLDGGLGRRRGGQLLRLRGPQPGRRGPGLADAHPAMAATATEMRRTAFERIAAHFRNTCLVASFGIGFLVLFAFLGPSPT